MPQNISATNAFTTNFEAGVPSQADPANIVQAFTEYHYGAGYTGAGLAGGMEKHLQDLSDDIVTASGLVSAHSGAASGVHGVSGTVVGTTGAQALYTKTLDHALVIAPSERLFYAATAQSGGSIQFDVETAGVLYHAGNASANFALNIRYNSGTSLSSKLAVADSYTLGFMSTNGASAYYATGFYIDGTAQTVKWQYGAVPTAGNVSAIDYYSYTIIKTAATPTYVVLASMSKFG